MVVSNLREIVIVGSLNYRYTDKFLVAIVSAGGIQTVTNAMAQLSDNVEGQIVGLSILGNPKINGIKFMGIEIPFTFYIMGYGR